MKIGMSLKIDVTKLDKARFFKGAKGTYADLTCFIDTEEVSQYGDHGTITQAVSQQERQEGVKLPILGNSKIFYSAGGQAGPANDPNVSAGNDQAVPNDQNIPF